MIREFLNKFIDQQDKVVGPGYIYSKKNMSIAPEYFEIRVWDGLHVEIINKVLEINEIKLLRWHIAMLSEVNGFHFYNIDFYGLPPGRINGSNLLDRSQANCLDLITANKLWRNGSSLTKSEGILIGAIIGEFINSSIYYKNDKNIYVNYGENRGVVKYNSPVYFLREYQHGLTSR